MSKENKERKRPLAKEGVDMANSLMTSACASASTLQEMSDEMYTLKCMALRILSTIGHNAILQKLETRESFIADITNSIRADIYEFNKPESKTTSVEIPLKKDQQ